VVTDEAEGEAAAQRAKAQQAPPPLPREEDNTEAALKCVALRAATCAGRFEAKLSVADVEPRAARARCPWRCERKAAELVALVESRKADEAPTVTRRRRRGCRGFCPRRRR